MSVTSQETNIQYITDGSTTAFPVPFYFVEPQDLLVQSIDASGNVTTYNTTTDYAVSGIVDIFGWFASGGNVNFYTPPSTNQTLLIGRSTPRIYNNLFTNGFPFTAESVNHSYDRLTIVDQELTDVMYLGLALGPPSVDNVNYLVGQWFKNARPTLQGPYGWVCIQAGYPGPSIFEPFGWITTSPWINSIGSSPPLNPQDGDLWFDCVGLQMYIWYNDGTTSQWVPVVNQGSWAPITNPANGQNNYAPIASPNFTGGATIDDQVVATEPWVNTAINTAITGLPNVYAPLHNPASGQNNYAPINNPVFTGTVTGPDNGFWNAAGIQNVQGVFLASNSWVSLDGTTGSLIVVHTTNTPQPSDAIWSNQGIYGIPALAVGILAAPPLSGIVVTQGNIDITSPGGQFQINAVNILQNTALLGVPTAATATPGTSTTQLATTAFVMAAITGSGVSSFNTRTGAVVLTSADITGAGGALTTSPAFTGTPTAPTAVAGTNTTQLATTAFVAAAVLSGGGGVTSFNTRTGAVTLQAADVTGVGGALLASPTFTGVPAAPTATAGTNTTQLATTAFVQAAVASGTAGVASFNTRTGIVTLTAADVTGVGGALLAGPTFTGVPSAPTAAPGTNTTQLATTAFVLANSVTSPVSVTNGGMGAGVAPTAGQLAIAQSATVYNPKTLSGDATITSAGAITVTRTSGTLFTALATAAVPLSIANGGTAATTAGAALTSLGAAPTVSPTFTGTPIAPTATAGTNTTQIATTAFVATNFAPLASPAFTGNPTATTQATADSSTNIATTAFVKAQNYAPIASPVFTGTPVMPGGNTASGYTGALVLGTVTTPCVVFNASGFSANGGINFTSGTAGILTLTHNSTYDGTNYTARGNYSEIIQFTTGNINFYNNSGLTNGSTYTPTLVHSFTTTAYQTAGYIYSTLQSGASQIILGPTPLGNAWGSMGSAGAGDSYITGGAYRTASATWTATTTAASLIDVGNGVINFYTNTGLSSASTFTPTLAAQIAGSSQLILPLATGASQMWFGSTTTPWGSITSGANTGNLGIAAGMYRTASAWTATYTNAALVNVANGYVQFYNNSGLTAGNTFTPTLTGTVNTAGCWSIGAITAGNTYGTSAATIYCNQTAWGIAVIQAAGSTAGNCLAFLNVGAATLVGYIQSSSTATQYNTGSDGRLKTNLEVFVDGRKILDQIPIQKFDWISNGERAIGVVAQDVKDIYSAAISVGHGEPGDEDFIPYGVDYSKYVPLLIQALQEAHRRIDALEVRMNN